MGVGARAVARVFGATATAVNFDDGTSGTTDRFAFVPFVDMANHHSEEGSAVVDAGDFFIRLRAARDLGAGRRGTISYGDIDRRQHYTHVRALEAEPAGGGDLRVSNDSRCVRDKPQQRQPSPLPRRRRGADGPGEVSAASPRTT